MVKTIGNRSENSFFEFDSCTAQPSEYLGDLYRTRDTVARIERRNKEKPRPKGKKGLNKSSGQGAKQEPGVYFAKIPQNLLRDRNIPIPARLLYGLYHSYSPEKNLEKRPSTFVSRNVLAGYLGCCPQSISNWARILREGGWISIRRRRNHSNMTTLYAKPCFSADQENKHDYAPEDNRGYREIDKPKRSQTRIIRKLRRSSSKIIMHRTAKPHSASLCAAKPHTTSLRAASQERQSRVGRAKRIISR